jgi:hypothetical protein
VSSLEEFDKLLKEFNPDLFVVGGLQMMDSYPYPEGKKVHDYRQGLKITVAWSPLVTRKFHLVVNFLLDIWELAFGDEMQFH